jgi:hypothetical protein
VPILPIPALPVEQFEDFTRFAQTTTAQDWPLSLAEMAQMAASILYALGQPSVIAGSEEIDALRYWLAFLGTEEWRQASIRCLTQLPIAPVDNSMSLALDNAAAGLDESAWAPADHSVKRFNAGCVRALGDFYESQRVEATRLAEEENQRIEAARLAEEEKQRAEAARLAEEEKQRTGDPPGPGTNAAAEAPAVTTPILEATHELDLEPGPKSTAEGVLASYLRDWKGRGQPTFWNFHRKHVREKLKLTGEGFVEKTLLEAWENRDKPSG